MADSVQLRELETQFKRTNPGDFGIFGDPIEHSLSPAMQNTALKYWWIDIVRSSKNPPIYHAFQVKPDFLKIALDLAKKHQLKGLNITVPHKEAALNFVPLLDEFAEQFQSLNTLTLNETGVKGYNTDGFGFETAIKKDLKFDPQARTVLILGAGGTGRVLLHQLVLSGIKKVYLWNRTASRISGLVQKFKKQIDIISVETPEELKVALSGSDLVINATSIGLKEGDSVPVPGLRFSQSQCYFDVVYHRETEFLQRARQAGASAIGGLSMLLYQGARSFEIWTKSSAPLKLMKKALIEKIKGKGLDSLWQFDT